MRPLEILLTLANLLAFISLAAPLPPAARWLRFAALAALLVMGAQILGEGPRWQMVPAYLLAGLFLLAGLARGAAALPGWLGILGAALGGLALAVSIALPALVPVFRFPRPGGPYAIGTLTYHWVDSSRGELLTADPDDLREVVVQVWYPARAGAGSGKAPEPWVRDAAELAPALGRLLRLPGFVFGHLRYMRSNAIPAAPAAGDEGGFPVLIFNHGLLGFRQHNTFQVEELVSRGYIVAGIDMPYAAAAVVFTDGRVAAGLPREQAAPLVRQSYLNSDKPPALYNRVFPLGIIPYLARDVVFTLDRLAELNRSDPRGILTGRLDLERAGIFGVSLGGIVGPEACRVDTRLKACLMMDAPMPSLVVRDGLRQPAMWLTRSADTMRFERERAGNWPEDEIIAHQETMRAVYESLPGPGYFVQMPGAFHLNYLDLPLLTPLARWVGIVGPVDGRRAHAIINAFTLAFFDRHLKGLPAPLLDSPEEQFPEVTVEQRR